MSRCWCAALVLISLAGCGDPPLPHVDGLEVGLNEDNFQSEVLNHEQPVLVDFGATWCGPCRRMEPIIAQASLNYEGHIKFGKVDVDDSPELKRKYRVGGIPALVLFHKGREIDRKTGLHTLNELSEWLEDYSSPTAAN